MARTKLTKLESRAIEECVDKFREHRGLFSNFASDILVDALAEDDELAAVVHSTKHRVKSESSLRAKLQRKFLSAPRGTAPEITATNLFEKIHDLAAVRILHLHANQLTTIVERIPEIARKRSLTIHEGPKGYCWDIEYESLFDEIGIQVVRRDTMYSTVHYVFQMNERTKIMAELQVRTLMEEVWAEVSHAVNYKSDSPNPINEKQLRVLARLTSGSTRLVDTIYDVADSLA